MSPCSRHIPTVIVQGRYDVVCPVSLLFSSFLFLPLTNRFDCKGNDCICSEEGQLFPLNSGLVRFDTVIQAFPEADLHIVPDAGHSARETGIAKLLVEVRCSNHTKQRPGLNSPCRQRTSSRTNNHYNTEQPFIKNRLPTPNNRMGIDKEIIDCNTDSACLYYCTHIVYMKLPQIYVMNERGERKPERDRKIRQQ